VFVLHGHGFHFGNHCHLADIFFFTTSYSVHELEWQKPGLQKIQQCGSIFAIPND